MAAALPPGKGDHEIWLSPINNHKFPVDGNIKSRDLANVVLKQAASRSESRDSRNQQQLAG
jgi:hypothetical protein